MRNTGLYIRNINYVIGHSGHSDGETPGLIPNPADKPASVPYCTELREHPGTKVRCYAHSFLMCDTEWLMKKDWQVVLTTHSIDTLLKLLEISAL